MSRFFVEMPGTAEFRSGWALGQIVSDAFPLAHASPETLELAEHTLAGELPAAVRRSLRWHRFLAPRGEVAAAAADAARRGGSVAFVHQVEVQIAREVAQLAVHVPHQRGGRSDVQVEGVDPQRSHREIGAASSLPIRLSPRSTGIAQ